MKRHLFTVRLKIRGPILIQSSSPADFGLDAAVMRRESDGIVCVPGTLIQGKLAEALKENQLGRSLPLSPAEHERLFGKDSGVGSGNEPLRRRLMFDDLIKVSVEGESGNPLLSRIAMDSTLGSAEGRMLRALETPFGAGATVTFEGNLWFVGPEGKRDEVKRLLRLGLRWLTTIGSQRSTGMGRLIEADIEESNLIELAAADNSIESGGGCDRLELSLRPLGPFCVSRPKIGDNLFESESHLPGNVLAGALVETWAALCDIRPGSRVSDCGKADPERSKLAEHFDRIRFRHAFPAAPGGVRTTAVPLSLAQAGERIFDLSLENQPCLLDAGGEDFVSPAFQPDWKPSTWSKIGSQIGFVEPHRELRVRTAIDSNLRISHRGDDTGGGKLFALELVHPWRRGADDQVEPLVWRTSIDLGQIPETDRRAVAEQLASLLPHLSYVGKTKVPCEVTGSGRAASSGATEVGETAVLMLDTPALLADPRFQSVEGVRESGALSAGEMWLLYRDAWSDLSGGSLELIHHFARQRLRGGNHLALRRQAQRRYVPWLLTDAGSVFTFAVRDAVEAAARL
ncbi:MAG: hypothetical protein KDM63_18220, partial [Verrucomicrobiae bacterium]|nr:hypothetical protein [Verrucomicrobiae bacterium]